MGVSGRVTVFCRARPLPHRLGAIMDYVLVLFAGFALGVWNGWYLKGRFGAQAAAVAKDLKQ